jgi:uncharacterized membrane protein
MAAEPQGVALATGVMAILGMGAVTYLARVGGLLLMAYVPPGPGVSAFLKHLSGCVLIALVVPTVWRGDVPVWAAVVATGVLARTKKPFLAIAAGMVVAAALRAL